MANTKYSEVLSTFQSMPMSKYVLDSDLCKEWFYQSLGDYELDISALDFNETSLEFSSQLSRYVIKTLGMLMYTYYLTRELSRAEKLNGISGKDFSLTGMDATKRVTLADLELEIVRVEKLIHKQKTHCYAN